MKIQIAYADAGGAHVFEYEVAVGSSVGRAVELSGVLERFPQIDLGRNKVGIFGRLVDLDALVKEGDRIEIYAPILRDPKQARRRRARDSDAPL